MFKLDHRRVQTELPPYDPVIEGYVSSAHIKNHTQPADRENPRAFRPAKSFVLGGEVAQANSLQYNGLKDKHLNQYFANKKRRSLLQTNGLVTREGYVIERTTCLTDCIKYKPVNFEKGKDLLLQATDRGTNILSIQLPQIRDVSPVRSKSLERTAINEKIFSLKRQRSYVNAIFPITPHIPQALENSKTARSRSPTEKALQKQFLYCQTPLEMFTEEDFPKSRNSPAPNHRRSQSKEFVSNNNTPKPQFKINSSTANLYNTLKPLSKEELTSVFDKFKTRASLHTKLAQEGPEGGIKKLLIEQAQRDVLTHSTISKRNSQSTTRMHREGEPLSQRGLKTIALKKYNFQNSKDTFARKSNDSSPERKLNSNYQREGFKTSRAVNDVSISERIKTVRKPSDNFSFAQNNETQETVEHPTIMAKTNSDMSFQPQDKTIETNFNPASKLEHSQQPIEESLNYSEIAPIRK